MKKYLGEDFCLIIPDGFAKLLEDYPTKTMDFFEDTVWEYVDNTQKSNENN